MKSQIKIFLLTLVLGLFISNSAFGQAQSSFDIQLNNDYTMTLNYGLSESGTYVGDVSQFASNMPDQQTADQFMEQFERDYVSIEVDLQSQKAMVTLELNATTSTWSKEQWNEHLKSN